MPETRGGRRGLGGRAAAGFVMVLLVATLVSGTDAGGWVLHLAARGDPLVAALDPPPRRGQALHVLVVVEDGRDGTTGLGDVFGDLAEQRADVVVLVRISSGVSSLVSLPRDVRVSTTHGDMPLAEVLSHFGPAGMVRATRAVADQPVHHYVEFGFAGVAAAVDAVGGLDVDLDHAMRDRQSGLLAPAGRSRLDGASAVAYLRSRTPEVLVDRTWVAMPAGDLGRVRRTQQALGDLVADIGQASATRWARLLVTLARHAEVDRTIVAGLRARLSGVWRPSGRPCLATVETRAEQTSVARTSPLGQPHLGALPRRLVVPGPRACSSGFRTRSVVESP